MPMSKSPSGDRVRITVEGPRDQINYRTDYYEPRWLPARSVSILDTLTISNIGMYTDIKVEVIPAPEQPKVYTYWRRQTAPFSESTSFRVDEAGQWQIFREGDWQDCIYIRSLEDLAHRAYTLRKLGPE